MGHLVERFQRKRREPRVKKREGKKKQRKRRTRKWRETVKRKGGQGANRAVRSGRSYPWYEIATGTKLEPELHSRKSTKILECLFWRVSPVRKATSSTSCSLIVNRFGGGLRRTISFTWPSFVAYKILIKGSLCSARIRAVVLVACLLRLVVTFVDTLSVRVSRSRNHRGRLADLPTGSLGACGYFRLNLLSLFSFRFSFPFSFLIVCRASSSKLNRQKRACSSRSTRNSWSSKHGHEHEHELKKHEHGHGYGDGEAHKHNP